MNINSILFVLVASKETLFSKFCIWSTNILYFKKLNAGKYPRFYVVLKGTLGTLYRNVSYLGYLTVLVVFPGFPLTLRLFFWYPCLMLSPKWTLRSGLWPLLKSSQFSLLWLDLERVRGEAPTKCSSHAISTCQHLSGSYSDRLHFVRLN